MEIKSYVSLLPVKTILVSILLYFLALYNALINPYNDIIYMKNSCKKRT